MNINAAIVDQRLSQVVEDIREEAAARLNITDTGRLKSLGFVFLCVKTLLDLESAPPRGWALFLCQPSRVRGLPGRDESGRFERERRLGLSVSALPRIFR